MKTDEIGSIDRQFSHRQAICFSFKLFSYANFEDNWLYEN